MVCKADPSRKLLLVAVDTFFVCHYDRGVLLRIADGGDWLHDVEVGGRVCDRHRYNKLALAHSADRRKRSRRNQALGKSLA